MTMDKEDQGVVAVGIASDGIPHGKVAYVGFQRTAYQESAGDALLKKKSIHFKVTIAFSVLCMLCGWAPAFTGANAFTAGLLGVIGSGIALSAEKGCCCSPGDRVKHVRNLMIATAVFSFLGIASVADYFLYGGFETYNEVCVRYISLGWSNYGHEQACVEYAITGNDVFTNTRAILCILSAVFSLALCISSSIASAALASSGLTPCCDCSNIERV